MVFIYYDINVVYYIRHVILKIIIWKKSFASKQEMVSSFSMLLLERFSYKASSEAKVAKILKCTISGEATLPFLSWPFLRMWVNSKRKTMLPLIFYGLIKIKSVSRRFISNSFAFANIREIYGLIKIKSVSQLFYFTYLCICKYSQNKLCSIHIFLSMRVCSVMRKVYTGCHGTSEIGHGLCALTKARGLSLRTGAHTMLNLSFILLKHFSVGFVVEC